MEVGLVFVNSGGSIWSFEEAEPVTFIVGAIRDGREEDVAMEMMMNRTAVNATNTYWRTSQNVFWIDRPILHLLPLVPLMAKGTEFPTSEFDLSRRT